MIKAYYSFNMRLYGGDNYYVTATYDPRTMDVERIVIPMLSQDVDVTDQFTKKQLTEIKLFLKKRAPK